MFTDLTRAEVRLYVTGTNGNVYIENKADPGDKITISPGHSGGETLLGQKVESIEFTDTTLDLTGGLTLEGSSAAEYGYGTGFADIIYGYAGNDYLYGQGGNDTLIGGDGNDSLTGGLGDDTYQFAAGWGLDTIVENASAGTDTVVFTDLTRAEVRLYITNTNGNVYIENKADPGDKITISPGNSGGETLLGQKFESIEFTDTTVDLTGGLTLEGSSAADTGYGTGFGDIIYGYAGNDYLYGQGGNDTLIGGDGNDTLTGGLGDDTFVYSAGLDTLNESGGTDTLWITGGVTVNDISIANFSTYSTKITVTPSVDVVTVNNLRHGTETFHVETLRFDDGFETDQLPDYNNWYWGTSSGETLTGTSGDNVLIGKAGADTIDAGDGADDAHGGDGADTLNGEDGDDLLHGGAGDDVLYGDDGLDTLFGGAGADTFMFEDGEAFNDVDVVKDFDISTDDDVLDISDILDTAGYQHGVDTLTDWVELSDSSGDTVVKVDRDGTGGTYSMEQIALLEGITGLTDESALVSSGNLVVS